MMTGDTEFTASSSRSLALVVFLLLLVPVFSLPVGMSVSRQKLLVLAAGMVLLLISEGLAFARSRRATLHIPSMVLCVLPLAGASLISLTHASNPSFVWLSLCAVLLSTLFVLFVARHAQCHRAIGWILSSCLCAGVVSSLVALVQYAGWMGDLNDTSVGRMVSTFGNRNYMGAFLSYLVFPTVALYLRAHTRLGRTLVACGLTTCVIVALLAQQTGTVLALAVGLLAILVGFWLFRLRRALSKARAALFVLSIPLLLALSAGFALWTLNPHRLPAPEATSLVSELWSVNSGPVREVNWWTGWEMVRAHPWTGVGLGNYKATFLPYKAQFLASPRGQESAAPMPRAEQAHNEFVQVVAELGIPGAIAIVAAMVLGATTLRRRLADTKPEARRLELLLLVAGVIVALAHCAVSFPFHLPASALLIATLVGLASSRYYGTSGSFGLHLGRRGVRVLGVVLLIVAVALAVGATRDWLAQVALSRGERELAEADYSAAQGQFERSVRLAVYPTRARLLLAYSHASLGDEPLQTTSADTQETHTQAAFRLATDALNGWQTEDAMLLVSATGLRLGNLGVASQRATDLLAAHPLERYAREALHLLASVQLASGDAEGAEAQLRDLIAAHPSHPWGSVTLAQILTSSGREAEAVEVLERAIWNIGQTIQDIDQQLETAHRKAAAELEWERRQLLLGQEAVIQAYEARLSP